MAWWSLGEIRPLPPALVHFAGEGLVYGAWGVFAGGGCAEVSGALGEGFLLLLGEWGLRVEVVVALELASDGGEVGEEVEGRELVPGGPEALAGGDGLVALLADAYVVGAVVLEFGVDGCASDLLVVDPDDGARRVGGEGDGASEASGEGGGEEQQYDEGVGALHARFLGFCCLVGLLLAGGLLLESLAGEASGPPERLAPLGFPLAGKGSSNSSPLNIEPR